MRGGLKTALVYGGGLIALYLVVANSVGAVADANAGTGFVKSTVSTLQGR
jgi:hypothetical protein